MNKRIMIALLAGALSLTCSAFAEPNWTPLFTEDGPVAEGWSVRDWADVSHPAKRPIKWEVRDGILHGSGMHSTNDDNWVGSWLLSEREYGDFVVEADFKFKNGGERGNGGIAVRAPLSGDPAYAGMEFQITDVRYEMSFFPGAGADELTGAIYLIQPPKELVYKAGEWNRYRIDVRGAKVKAWLNDVLVQDINLENFISPARRHGEGQEFLAATPGKERPRRGRIGFQDLSDSGEVLLFRNVRIQALD